MVRISILLKKLIILSIINRNANIYILQNREALLSFYIKPVDFIGLTQAIEDFYEFYLELLQPYLTEA
jgi:hypothetical protein